MKQVQNFTRVAKTSGSRTRSPRGSIQSMIKVINRSTNDGASLASTANGTGAIRVMSTSLRSSSRPTARPRIQLTARSTHLLREARASFLIIAVPVALFVSMFGVVMSSMDGDSSGSRWGDVALAFLDHAAIPFAPATASDQEHGSWIAANPATDLLPNSSTSPIRGRLVKRIAASDAGKPGAGTAIPEQVHAIWHGTRRFIVPVPALTAPVHPARLPDSAL